MTYSGDRSSAARQRALRRLACEDRRTYRALYEQTQPQAHTHDQAHRRALTLLRHRHPDRYLELYAQERVGPGTDARPEIRSRAWRKASRRLAARDATAFPELFEHAKTGGLTGSRAHDLAVTQLRSKHQELFARLLAAEITRCLRCATRPLARCPGCGGDAGNNWSDGTSAPSRAPSCTPDAPSAGRFWATATGRRAQRQGSADRARAGHHGCLPRCDLQPPPARPLPGLRRRTATLPEHETDRQQAGQYSLVAEEIRRHISAVAAHPQPHRPDDHHPRCEESHA